MKEAGASRKQFTEAEKIIAMLREAEVALAQGKKVGENTEKWCLNTRSLLRLGADRDGFCPCQS